MVPPPHSLFGLDFNIRQLTLLSLLLPTASYPISCTDRPSFPSQLKEKANLTLAVGTLPLPSQFNFIPPGRMCRATGWGRTNVEEPLSDSLQEVKLRLLDPQACKHFRSFRHNPQLCVGNPRKTKSVYKVILQLGSLTNQRPEFS